MKSGRSLKEEPAIQGESEFPIFFQAREIGQNLKEVAVDVIETEEANVMSRWFRSGKDVDLFIWSDEQRNIIKQQVSFYGQVVEWNAFEGLKTGLVIEQEANSREEAEASEMIRFDLTPQSHAVQQAQELIIYATEVSAKDRQTMIENLSGKSMTEGRFLIQSGRLKLVPPQAKKPRSALGAGVKAAFRQRLGSILAKFMRVFAKKR